MHLISTASTDGFFKDIVSTYLQLYNFISGAERLKPFERAYMELYPDQQISWIAQLCNRLSLLLSHVKWLEISGDADSQVEPQDGVQSTQWLELFLPFTAVQSLYVSQKLGPLVTRALQELAGKKAIGILPSLCYLSLGALSRVGRLRKFIERFVAARRLPDRPVVVERWEQVRYRGLIDDYW